MALRRVYYTIPKSPRDNHRTITTTLPDHPRNDAVSSRFRRFVSRSRCRIDHRIRISPLAGLRRVQDRSIGISSGDGLYVRTDKLGTVGEAKSTISAKGGWSYARRIWRISRRRRAKSVSRKLVSPASHPSLPLEIINQSLNAPGPFAGSTQLPSCRSRTCVTSPRRGKRASPPPCPRATPPSFVYARASPEVSARGLSLRVYARLPLRVCARKSERAYGRVGGERKGEHVCVPVNYAHGPRVHRHPVNLHRPSTGLRTTTPLRTVSPTSVRIRVYVRASVATRRKRRATSRRLDANTGQTDTKNALCGKPVSRHR